MRYKALWPALLLLAACASPYRAEAVIKGEVEARIVHKGDADPIYQWKFDEDGTLYCDGRWVHIEYISGKTWSYDIRSKERVDDATARAGLGLPVQP